MSVCLYVCVCMCPRWFGLCSTKVIIRDVLTADTMIKKLFSCAVYAQVYACGTVLSMLTFILYHVNVQT